MDNVSVQVLLCRDVRMAEGEEKGSPDTRSPQNLIALNFSQAISNTADEKQTRLVGE